MTDSSPGAGTTQCLENLAAICRAAGTELGNALRMTIYTTRLYEFAQINEASGASFPRVPPARVAIGVPALVKGANVELDAIVEV